MSNNKKSSTLIRNNRKRAELTGKEKKPPVDFVFLAILLLVLVVGLVSLFSASFANAFYHKQDSYHYITRQVIFALGGIFFMMFTATLDYSFFDNGKIVWGLYGITIVLLIGVFFFDPINNAQRWIHVGAGDSRITFQPSEFAKFTVVIMLAHLINLNHDRMNTRRYGVIPPVMALIPIVGLVVMEPHLSATILIILIAGVMLFIGGVQWRWFVLLGSIVTIIVGILAITGTIHYVLPRFEIWKDPWSSPRDLGYQTIQSLYAIGSGGIMGEGIGGSTQKYLYLPELQNDYIFAIVCEELGFVGSSIVIILFALLVWRGFLIGIRSKDRFGALVAIGLTSQVGLQVILNILVVTNTIPPTGISLPFFSAGGTSLTMLLAQMGVILSVSRYPVGSTPFTQQKIVMEEEAI